MYQIMRRIANTGQWRPTGAIATAEAEAGTLALQVLGGASTGAGYRHVLDAEGVDPVYGPVVVIAGC